MWTLFLVIASAPAIGTATGPATGSGTADRAGKARTAAPAALPPGVVVDWVHFVLEASGSAASDLYPASVDVARLKAERLARARAEDRLRRALPHVRADARWQAKFGHSPVPIPDVAQARVAKIEYGTNGSVTLRLALPLGPTAATDPKSPTTNGGSPDMAGGAPHNTDGGSPSTAAQGEDSP